MDFFIIKLLGDKNNDIQFNELPYLVTDISTSKLFLKLIGNTKKSKEVSLSIFADEFHRDTRITALTLYNEAENKTYLFDLISISNNEKEYGKQFFELFKLYLIVENIKIIMYDSRATIDILHHQYNIKFIEIVDLKVNILEICFLFNSILLINK